MEVLGVTGIAAITILCYIIGEVVKATPLDNKWIPIICGVCGGALGIPGMMVIADYPANDPITAIAVGVVSGLTATAINQIGKQFSK